jgi:hypothetical protein
MFLMSACIGAFAAAPDGVTLHAAHGQSQQDVSLTWAGASSPYRVYRSSSPQNLAGPANQIGQTTNLAWVDVAPVGSALYYLVTPPSCPNVVADGGFEAGQFAGIWAEASTNFGTPICDEFNCGVMFTPRSGAGWVWFGGIQSREVASVTQSVVIAPGVATLTFWLEVPGCDGGGSDSFVVTIDSTTVFATNDLDPYCNTRGYRLVSVNVSAFANGATHVLRIKSDTGPNPHAITSFNVDDVSLAVCP